MFEISGYYYLFRYKTNKESHEYFLEIKKENQSRQNFKMTFKKTTQFGKIGSNWEGICEKNGNYVLFHINNAVDWRELFMERGREEFPSEFLKTIKASIKKENNQIKFDLFLETKTLTFSKTEAIIEQISPQIIDKLIEYHKLRKNKAIQQAGVFWRISNLIFGKPNKLHNGNQIYQTFLEYDMDIVKEEKRVTNFDEYNRNHYSKTVIFSEKDHKLVEFRHK